MTYRKKLIEVDLPLDSINKQSAREKSIRHGHPSTLHMWWARRPLAACRAVLFASMVDDPSERSDELPTKEEQDKERARLHCIIEKLIEWENSNNEEVLIKARQEIALSVARSRGEAAPTEKDAVLAYLNDVARPVYDPFSGGGSIPLEAQRLGFRAIGTDLNPIAVLITKSLIELPCSFRNRPPVNPTADPMGFSSGRSKKAWRGASGLANDIRYYGRQMQKLARERIGRLYPKVEGTTVIAWLWARTVLCSNPACGAQMPLMRTFQASKKSGNQHWIRPIIDNETKSVSFIVQRNDDGVPQTGTVNRNGATCLLCGSAMPLSDVRKQARDGKMGEQMTAIVAEGNRQRLFFSPTQEHVQAALSAEPVWRPMQTMPDTPTLVSGRGFGITHWHQLFTKRQLTALTTFSDLLSEMNTLMKQDGADTEYANSVCTYLALIIGRIADSNSKFSTWQNVGDKVAHVFARQAIPMVWDFAEANPFSSSTQNWMAQVEWVAKVVENLPSDVNEGKVHQADASTTVHADYGPVIVTDPPYYDNIDYADLSDYFYVWLRPLLRDIYPSLFAGMLTPKGEEMTAIPSRFSNPRERFEELLSRALRLIKQKCSPEFPSSIFYAYKQQQEERDGRTSTGWETMLTALVSSGFRIIGTWPMRTERAARSNALATNALASSVVLVCRPRDEDAPVATRRQFLDALESNLPAALDHLTREGHIAPVDLAQAAIGPGMAIYSQFSRVETISGEPVPVRAALAAINRVIAEYHQREQGDLDENSQFCLSWLTQYGYTKGDYGSAEVLAQAKNVSVETLKDWKLLEADGGHVRLLPLDGYGFNRPMRLESMTAWEGCFRMAYHLNREDGQGNDGAADVARTMGSNAESVERLARVLYNYYDGKDDSPNAVIFNNLVTSWPDISVKAAQGAVQQGRLISDD